MNDLYTLADFKVGDIVRAFHPRTFGVVYTAEVKTVGRTWLTVDFKGGDYATRRIAPRDVTGFA